MAPSIFPSPSNVYLTLSLFVSVNSQCHKHHNDEQLHRNGRADKANEEGKIMSALDEEYYVEYMDINNARYILLYIEISLDIYIYICS